MDKLRFSHMGSTAAAFFSFKCWRLAALIVIVGAIFSGCGGGGGGSTAGSSSVVVSKNSAERVSSSSVLSSSSIASLKSSSNSSSLLISSSSVRSSGNSVSSTSNGSVRSNISSSIATSSSSTSYKSSSSYKSSTSIPYKSSSFGFSISSSNTSSSSASSVAAITSIEVVPGSVVLAVNGTQQLVAIGKSGSDLVNLFGKVTWRISSGSEFASITSSGLLKRSALGNVEVEASVQGKTALLKLASASQNLTVQYDNSKTKWAKVNIHFWNDAGTTTWPGIAMTNNNDIWSYEINASKLVNGSIKVIFNNGAGSQTDDAHALVKESATFSDGIWTPLKSATTSALVSIFDGTIKKDGMIFTSGTSFSAGTILTINANPSSGEFSGWSGASAAYMFTDPNKSEAQLVVPDNISSIALQPSFASKDPYKSARNMYVAKCVGCHGVNGSGGPNPALNALGAKYNLAALVEKINTMPANCVGSSAGDCAYDVANMIVLNQWIPPDACVGANCTLGSRNLRLLTREEYLNSIRDIFSSVTIDAAVIANVPGDGTSRNFNTASFLVLDQDRTLGYQMASEAVAKQIINSKSFFNLVDNCNNAADCVVAALGKKVFRRPLSQVEINRYTDLYDPSDAGKAVIQGLLISPNFLYRSEVGVETSPGSGLYRLTNYEIATLLSYSFWASTPDDQLLTAAASNSFDIKGQVTRMLADARADRGLRRFAQGWLLNSKYGYSPFSSQTLPGSFNEETIRFAMEVIKANKPFSELLTANYTYANAELAQYYGSSPVANGWAQSTFADNDPRSGSGILGQGSFLASRATNIDNPSPIKRGLFVRNVLLCQELPPPQKAGLAIPRKPEDSNRKANANHTSDSGCAGCHQYIDGIGFGLEKFGSDAKYREQEKLGNGQMQAIDASGWIKSLDSEETSLNVDSKDVSFTSVPALAKLIADSGKGSACYSRQFYRYIIGRDEELADQAVIPAYSEKVRAGGGMREMLIDLALNPSFILRR